MTARLFLATLAAVAVAAPARADTVTLTSSAPPGSPVTVNAGSVSSAVRVQVNNATTPATATLSAWRFSLVIAPIGAASGTVTFNSPTTQTFTPPAGQPSPYLLNGNSVGIDVTNGGTSFQANDFANTPVTIPTGLSNLLQVDFLAAAGASGSFGVYAVQGAGNTQYTDGTPATAFFSNVPLGTGTVEIARINVVPVPEPATLGLLVVSAFGIGRWTRLRVNRG